MLTCLSCGIDQFAVADFEAGLLQQPRRFAQIVAHIFGTAADRILVRRGENLRRHLVAQRLQHFQFEAFGKSGGHEVGDAVEIAAVAMVLAGRQRPVHLLEIEGEVEGAAQPDILEQRTAEVEGPTLHASRTADRKQLLDHPLVVHRREVVGHRPFLGAALGVPVELVGPEGLAADDVVAEEFIAQFVEIVLADARRQVLAPVIPYPLQHQRPAGDEVLDAVRTRSQRRLQRGRRHVALAALGVGAFPPVFRQHVELAGDQRKLAIARAVEGELDVVLTDPLGLDDMLVIEAVPRAVAS